MEVLGERLESQQEEQGELRKDLERYQEGTREVTLGSTSAEQRVGGVWGV